MTASNLGIVFGPTLLRKRNVPVANVMSDILKSNSLIETMVNQYDVVFGDRRHSISIEGPRKSLSRQNRYL